METIEFDFIFSFVNSEQEFSVKEIEMDKLNDPESLFNAITENMLEEKRNDLCKISCCAHVEPRDLPYWFLTENGKLWIDNGKLY